MKTPECLLAYAEELEQYYARHYPPLAPLAKPCFLSTVQTTMEPLPGGETFVITGDIPAMWLRDSSAQVKNYLPFAAKDEQVRSLLRGVIATQVKDVLIDAYANAFNREANGKGFQDKTERNPAVWERKYEVDSLCAPILLAQQYEDASGDTAIYTEAFHRMLRRIAEVFRLEQHHERSPYSFERENCPPSDTLPGGRGTPVGFTGMTWSGFRPSDDRCEYGYFIPANMMAVVAMNAAARMAEGQFADKALAHWPQSWMKASAVSALPNERASAPFIATRRTDRGIVCLWTTPTRPVCFPRPTSATATGMTIFISAPGNLYFPRPIRIL